MIWLDRQFDDAPLVFTRHVMNGLLQSIRDLPDKDLPPPLRTPDEMVDDEMHRMLFMLVLVFYVGIIRYNNVCCQQCHPSPAPNKEGQFISYLERQGLSWPCAVTDSTRSFEDGRIGSCNWAQVYSSSSSMAWRRSWAECLSCCSSSELKDSRTMRLTPCRLTTAGKLRYTSSMPYIPLVRQLTV